MRNGPGGGGHHLRQAQRTGGRERLWVERALFAHQGLQQIGRNQGRARDLGDLIAEGQRIGERGGAKRERRARTAQERTQLGADERVRVAKVVRAAVELGDERERFLAG